MIDEFRSFLLKTGALALAIGVIIGVALGIVVNSLVNDIIMPPIGVLLGGVNFGSLVIKLRDATTDAAGKPVPEVDIRYGTFVSVVFAFIVIAFVVFIIARQFMRPEPEAPGAQMKNCPFCRETVFTTATKCRYCGSPLGGTLGGGASAGAFSDRGDGHLGGVQESIEDNTRESTVDRSQNPGG